jgi:hypothetical protein
MNVIEPFGWLCVVVATALTVAKLVRQRRWKRALGTVVSLGPARPGETPKEPIPPIYFPVMRFSTEENREIFEEVRDFRIGPCIVGDTVAVLYDPAEPSRFCSANGLRRCRGEAAFAVLGLFLVFIARHG